MKLFLFSAALWLISVPNGYSQDNVMLKENLKALKTADSLFQQKRYTQSYRLYSDLLDQNAYSPAMLSKMAYIAEALDKKPETLYFLNLYYLATGNPDALQKMEDYAAEHKLSGYESDDGDLFSSLFHRYQDFIILFTMALAIFLFISMVVQKRRYNKKPYVLGSLFLSVMLGLSLLINTSPDYGQAIILHEDVPVMKGPSPGSEMSSVLQQGHRVKIVDQTAAWTKVLWDNQPVYIRNHHLALIRLNF